MRIVAVGECTRDRYVSRGVDRVGGISLNFAVHVRTSGASEVALVSCTGTDDWGPAVRAALSRAGVNAAHVHTRDGATASQLVELDEYGERRFPPGGYDPGVLSAFSLGPDDLAFIGRGEVVAAPYFRQIAHLFGPAMRAAAPGARRVADFLDGEDLGPGLSGIDAWLDTVDVAFVSGGDEAVEWLRPRSAHTRTLIVVTHGAGGCRALEGGRPLFEPAVHVPPDERIDTTGCGDAFQAAFTVAWASGCRIQAALRAGTQKAASVVRHLGAIPA
jgi:sugar/nucleoside kinase (ribokinase family)